MQRAIACGAVVAGLVGGWAAAAGPPQPLDLAALDRLVEPPVASAGAWGDVAIYPVAARAAADHRLYVTGLLGEAFVTLDDPLYGELFDGSRLNRSVIAAGGAVGVARELEDGRLRVEVEGRGRDDVTAASAESLAPLVGAEFRWAAADGWSALVNVWRDFSVAEQVDLYFGGGLGAGGYRYQFVGDVTFLAPLLAYEARSAVAALAWQAGGGVVWNLSDRVALDVGYRFFAIDQSDTTLDVSLVGTPIGSFLLSQQYTASELLFGLRVYEPFRRWR